MFDISKITGSPYMPYVFLGLIALIYLICIIKFTKAGFIKDLFTIVYLVALVFLCIKYGPVLAQIVLGFGVLPETILSFTNQQVATVLSYVAIFIVWIIAKKILNAIFKKLFEVDKKAMKFFGFLFSIPFSLVLSLLLIVVCSPFLVHGSEKLYNNQYTQIYVEKIIEPIQDQLFAIGVPSSYEALVVNKAANDDNKQDYYDAFKNIKNFTINPGSYLSTSFESEELKEQFIDDLTIVNNVVASIGNEKIAANYTLYLSDYVSLSSGSSIQCGEKYESLYSSFASLAVSEETLTGLQSVFVE